MLKLLKRILRKLLEIIPNQTVYKSGQIKIIVEDNVGNYSENEHIELCEFIHHHLLSDDEDLSSLTFIIIKHNGSNGTPGSWTGGRFSRNNCTLSIKAEIVLNYTYNLTIKDAKTTLAHEYGHHWTFFYCLRNHWDNDSLDNHKNSYPRLPDSYYVLRGLSQNDYSYNYSKDWHFCDKEVIAEDYRILFAPTPHNENHAIIEILTKNNLPVISLPNASIKKYIEKLK